jgi:hypothetical protein
MAISDSLRISILSSQNVGRSVSQSKSQLLRSNISLNKISQVISNNTKQKESIAYKSNILDLKRREASKRKEIEDRIEASNVTTNAFSYSARSIVNSTSGGPLKRLISFLGFITAGWLVENLPTIIFTGKEFISRVLKLSNLITSFVSNTFSIITNFGYLLQSVSSNILSLDFTDKSEKIKNSFNELNLSIESVNNDIINAYKLLTAPLTQSSDVEEEAPDSLYPQPYQPPGQQSSSGSGGFGGSGLSKGTQIAKRLQKDLGLKDYQASAVVGNLLQENTNLVPDLLEGSKKGLLTDAMRKGIGYGWAQWTDPGRQKELYQLAQSMGVDPSKQPLTDEINYAMLVRELPRYDSGGRFRNSKSIEEASNWILFQYENPADKSAREQSERINDSKKVFQTLKSAPSSTISQTPTAPPRPISTGTMNLIPQTGAGGFIQGGSGSNEMSYATHFHLDYKSKTNDPSILSRIREVAFHAVKSMFARGSTVYFGNLGQFASKNDIALKNQIMAEQKAHGARSTMSVDIQEQNRSIQRTFPSQPGSASKFPFQVGAVYWRGGYGREAEIIGSGGITVSHGAAGSKGVESFPTSRTTKPDLYPTVKTEIPKTITPERQGQQVLIVDVPSSDQQVKPQTQMVSKKEQYSQEIDEIYLLNKFIKQKFLLELAYL